MLLCLLTLDVKADTFPPRNDAMKEPGFKAFYRGLTSAVNRRDAGYLHSVLRPDSFVGPRVRGIDLKPNWEDPKDEWWQWLGWALDLGGTAKSLDTIIFPYSATSRGRDPYSHAVIVGQSVNIRKGPGREYPSVGSSSYEIVEYIQVAGDWYKIRTPGGQVGYVYWRYIQVPGGPSVVFKKANGEWYLASFTVGTD